MWFLRNLALKRWSCAITFPVHHQPSFQQNYANNIFGPTWKTIYIYIYFFQQKYQENMDQIKRDVHVTSLQSVEQTEIFPDEAPGVALWPNLCKATTHRNQNCISSTKFKVAKEKTKTKKIKKSCRVGLYIVAKQRRHPLGGSTQSTTEVEDNSRPFWCGRRVFWRRLFQSAVHSFYLQEDFQWIQLFASQFGKVSTITPDWSLKCGKNWEWTRRFNPSFTFAWVPHNSLCCPFWLHKSFDFLLFFWNASIKCWEAHKFL